MRCTRQFRLWPAAGAVLGPAALAFMFGLGAATALTGVAAAPAAVSPALSPVLGIRGMPLFEMHAGGQGERSVLRLNKIDPGGRGAAAGLLVGDILLDADGQDVADVASLEQRLLALAPGATLVLRLRRGGQTQSITLTRPTAPP